MKETEFKCCACGKTATHDFANREPYPTGWFNRHLDEYENHSQGAGKPYILCESCGNEGHFVGGTSPHLRELFRSQGVEFKEAG